jgi:transcriptional regulator with XRE-family HTH domain
MIVLRVLMNNVWQLPMCNDSNRHIVNVMPPRIGTFSNKLGAVAGIMETRRAMEIIRETLRIKIREDYKSNEEFAYANGIDKSTLSRILNGARDPRVSTLLKIAESLNLTLNDLYLEGYVRGKTQVYTPKRVKKRKITMLLAESDMPLFQEKLKSVSPLVFEVRVAGN